jgi:8-oxo-dGTP diphosphatase
MEKIQELNAYLVIRNKGKLLLLQRHNRIWEFPGGGVEFGESPKEAALREAQEETGLVAKEARLIGATSAVFESKGREKHAVYAVYIAKSFKGKLLLSCEHLQAKWATAPEAKKLKLGLNAKPVLEMI